MRRIPETDLARITVLPEFEQKIRLRKLKGFRPPHTLNPFKKSISDIMNVQFELLGESKTTKWETIEQQILRSNENDHGKTVNLAVARALFEFCVERKIVSHDKPSTRWPVGFGNSVEYWESFYSVWSDQATFVHFDPRLSNSLTKQAMKFVFSMMHERLRVDDPDFAQIDITIFKFGKAEGGKRLIRAHSVNEVELFSRDQLNEMITTTYELWVQELGTRQEEARKATGTNNPMGF